MPDPPGPGPARLVSRVGAARGRELDSGGSGEPESPRRAGRRHSGWQPGLSRAGSLSASAAWVPARPAAPLRVGRGCTESAYPAPGSRAPGLPRCAGKSIQGRGFSTETVLVLALRKLLPSTDDSSFKFQVDLDRRRPRQRGGLWHSLCRRDYRTVRPPATLDCE